MFWYTLLCELSSFTIILKRKRELVALFLLSYVCLVTVYVLWLFLMVLWVGLHCVIVVFPDYTHFFLSGYNYMNDTSRENGISILIRNSITYIVEH